MIPHHLAPPYRFIAFDVETANRNAHSICQVGLACVDDWGQIDTFSLLVDPGEPFSHFNTQLHGIDARKVRGAARFPEIIAAIAPLMLHQPIVQHSCFDQRAVAAACDWHGLETPSLHWVNSVTIARRAWPEFRGNGGHGLGHLKKVLSLQFQHHDAGEDARAAAQVVLHAEQKTQRGFVEIMAKRSAPIVILKPLVVEA
ncbi:MAG: polymerase subunit epsilon [Cypionkella sp.]|uniref:exonuclease domain-containing protein n=1 Tax=Cypionkella sp. TaxID=2811411 RepID=UPI00260F5E44|nr:exonuclease domain-containing protein [Cypionkella sp.]MDB5658964.1 polymerase subunit epsilon [Cypionkella sp.]